MKKFIAIAISAMFLLGFAVSAFALHAEIPTGTQAVYADDGTMLDIGGDMRVRGVWRRNFDLDSDTEYTHDWSYGNKAEARYYDQRYRLTFIVKTDGGIEARMRAVFGQNYVWGARNGFSVSSCWAVTVGDGDCDSSSRTKSYAPSADFVEWDWAYLHFPLFGGSFDVGKQRANWGHRFLVWDKSRDRIKYITHFGDVVFGLLLDKLHDSITPLGQDTDDYAILAIWQGEGVTLGAIAIYVIDDSASDCCDGTFVGDIYGTVNMGVATLKFEVAIKAPENASDNAYGGFAQVIVPLDAISLDIIAAFAQNGYVADSYFAPTVFVGTVNPTAMFNFGSFGDMFLVALTGSFMVTDSTTVGARLAYVDFTGEEGGNFFEIDAFLKQKLAKNTTYYIDLGVMFPSDLWGENDMALALAHKIEVTF